MEPSQRRELLRWAEALERSDDPDLKAAGRGIRLLCETGSELRQGVVLPSLSKIERRELESWAKELGGATIAELRAAGRAIRSLCTELDELERGHAATDAEVAPSEAPSRTRRSQSPPRGHRARRPSRRTAYAALGALGLTALALTLAALAARPEIEATGPAEGAIVGKTALADLSFSSPSDAAEWSLDGKSVRPSRTGGETVFRPADLAEGAHELVIRKEGSIFGAAERSFRFVVDTSPPKLELAGPAVVNRGKPLRIAGTLEPGAALASGTKTIPVAADGTFELHSEIAPRRLLLTATDAAGNSSRWRVPVTVVPRRPSSPIRSVHVTAYGWADDSLRAGVMELIRARKINAVELDLKDESGEVGWPSGVPLAKQMGSQLEIYDLKQVTTELHRLGVRVIGRLVVFRDPIHAQAAWKAGRRNEVVQSQDGAPYSGYGGFTNFANPAVRRYNIDLAVAAAKLGVDEILYDYVRRPDGPISSMVFPGIDGTPEQAIVRFLAESRAALADTETLIGASVFGVAATRPEEVAQDIPAMARHLDYVAPMLYPSHWGPGEYDVADPNGQPYEITLASSKDFVKQVRGSGARIVNWLQDFSYGRTYGPAEVRAQIKASRDAGVDEFILWDAAVTYTADALEPTAQLPALGISLEPPRDAPMPVRLPSDAPAALARGGARRPATDPRPQAGLPANELGQVPVVMHHMIRADRVGDYDQTPQEFQAELEYLWKHGYTPVAVSDLVSGKLDVPRGTTPVVFTFDDATTYQFELDSNGSVKPKTAVGIMLEFARTHPGFRPSGTFYVNRTPFGSAARVKKTLRWLTENGFEIGNHTHDHIPLRTLSEADVRKQVATGAQVIEQPLPGYRIRSLALPLGSMPKDAALAVRGSWQGRSYGPYAVLLVGANPAPSPFSKAFDPAAIPRIRTSHAGWNGEADYGFSYWMRQFEVNPKTRFISDGDPATLVIRPGADREVKPRFAVRVRTAP
ncbi:MAG: putative glycoside hydrolase [Gaiellaceae bacterium]